MIDAFVTDGFGARQRSCWLQLRWIFAAVLFAPVRRVAVFAFIPGDQSFQVKPGTGALFRDKTRWDPRQCCCFNSGP